jgi:CHAT domain-containing protein/tetratricopeptide (TPR) repeat protein
MKLTWIAFAVWLFGVDAGAQRNSTGRQDLDWISQRGLELVKSYRFPEAADAFRVGAAEAKGSGSIRRAALFWNAAGGAETLGHLYARALDSYGKAAEAAEGMGAREIAGVAYVNLSSVHTALGEVNRAGEYLRLAEGRIPEKSAYRGQYLWQKATLSWMRGEVETLRTVVEEGLGVARTNRDPVAQVGLLLVKARADVAAGDLGSAERSLLEAVRITGEGKTRGYSTSLRWLGWLRRLQGNQSEAGKYLLLAVQENGRRPDGGLPWLSEFEYGDWLESRGRAIEALPYYRIAFEKAALWRTGVPTSQPMEVMADENLSAPAEALTKVTAGMALRGEGDAYKWESFLTNESSRAVSMRRLAIASRLRAEGFSAEYGDRLTRFRSASSGLTRPEWGTTAEMNEAILGIEEKEFGLPLSLARSLHGDELQKLMLTGESYFGFVLSEPRSYRWTVSGGRLDLAGLPGEREITKAVEEFRSSVQSGHGTDRAGGRLYRMLFEGAPGAALRSKRWLIGPDGALFGVPWAALPGTEGRRYLAETKVVQSIPALVMRRNRAAGRMARTFLAAGDPVYNRADPRFAGPSPAAGPMAFLLWDRERREPNGEQLPRLPGSGREVASLGSQLSKAGWRTQVLVGNDVNPARFSEALDQGAGVVHLAMHMGMEEGSRNRLATDAERVYLALSLAGEGGPARVTAATIASRKRLQDGLVALNGCNSGGGATLPGAGLQSLSNAWMIAGARGVVATLWTVSDDAGSLFAPLYLGLNGGIDAAEALREAQLQMLRAGGWKANPKYWAAYTYMGRE